MKTKKSQAKKIYHDWFKSRGWKPLPYQERMLLRYLDGYHGILNAPTGSGKTYALWLPVLVDYISGKKSSKARGLKVLWITPVRALAADLQKAMQQATDELGLDWEVKIRTGDTTSSERQKQKRTPPDALITTPESLHLILANKGYADLLKSLEVVVIDEWHELLSTKRGVQAELALNRIRNICPDVRTWGISATIGNLDEALEVLLGDHKSKVPHTIVKSDQEKKVEIHTLIPEKVERFPWGGHLGIRLLHDLIPVIMKARSVLVFTNTRSQTEIWYQNILEEVPELAGIMAMHHGSLSQEIRIWVEDALRSGGLQVVVCTSSLDLGVDFRPVDTVVQIGGPKGVARFVQRAGRSGHKPGETSHIWFVPTHSLELIEVAALRTAIKEGKMESRPPVVRPFDVLVQYMVTLAVSDGFKPEDLYKEVIQTHAFNSVSPEEWNTLLQFITTGGESLSHYPDFQKAEEVEGLIVVQNRKTAMRHRMSIGTIVSDPVMVVKYQGGGRIGTIEEYFITKLKPGDVFSFGGRKLELIHVRDMVVTVRNSKAGKAAVPQWLGGKMPLSSEVSGMIREKLHGAAHNQIKDPEMKALKPLLDLQKTRSIIPDRDQFLIEKLWTKEGCHVFFYTFEGRYINEGMIALVSQRLSFIKKQSFSISMNDYGFELLAEDDIPVEEGLKHDLFSTENLVRDIEAGLNASELARRKFRDIAHIAGLVFQGYPGKRKEGKHLQASSRLFFDVFSEYEPDHFLLLQAYEEVRFQQLDEVRLRKALLRIEKQEIVVKYPSKPSPFCFPVMTEKFRDQMSTEAFEDRMKKMILRLEKEIASEDSDAEN